MVTSVAVESLRPHHDRPGFSCGNASLDDFIKTKARKEQELGFSAVFVAAADASSPTIFGFYSLSSHSISVQGIPPQVRKRFPRYPLVPTTLLGRLATSITFRRQGVGEVLLLDALKRALQSAEQVGSYAVVVDAIDGAAVSFYSKYGFLGTADRGDRLYLPMASIRHLGL